MKYRVVNGKGCIFNVGDIVEITTIISDNFFICTCIEGRYNGLHQYVNKYQIEPIILSINKLIKVL